VLTGELEQSLREEIEGHINGRLTEMQDEIARIHSQVNEAFTRLLESASGEQADGSVAAFVSEHLRAAHERGVEQAVSESSRAQASSDLAIIKAAVDDMDNQRSQVQILNVLVNRAASFAPRVAFFVIKKDQAVGWRARGLEGTIGDEAINTISIPLSENTPISDVVQSRAAWSGSPGGNSADHDLLSKLGGDPPQRMVSVPLVVRGRSVAVLYADSAGLDSNAINLEALETLVRVAGMAVELLAVSRPPRTDRPARVEAPAVAPAKTEEPEQPPVEEAATPSEQEPDVTAVMTPEPEPELAIEPPVKERGVEPFASSGEEHGAASWEDTVRISRDDLPPSSEFTYPQPISVAPETQTHSGTSDSGAFGARLGSARQYGAVDAELPVNVSDEEKRLHNDARRFARLLVSEIKLYNEQKVTEGRSQGDIYERLRDDIDRSRQMYDKRVAPPVASRFDYFHEELVNTLAEGDPAKLGESYPGTPAVSA
jgi:hypothetical protein